MSQAWLVASRLVALNPAWRDDTRGTPAKFFFYAQEIVERLANDLAAAGLCGRS